MESADLFESYHKEVSKIDGWYDFKGFNPVLEILQNYHRSLDITGNIGEIGIHHGKSFLAVASLVSTDERLLAVDCFSHQEHNIDHSGLGNRDKFEEHARVILTESQLASLKILEMNSNDLTDSHLEMSNGLKFRIFSIDGSHTADATYRDLDLVSKSLDRNGFIIVDDYWHSSDIWAGVKIGTDRFIRENKSGLIPVYVSTLVGGTNKMVLVHRSVANDVYVLLKDKHYNQLSSLCPTWDQLKRPVQ